MTRPAGLADPQLVGKFQHRAAVAANHRAALRAFQRFPGRLRTIRTIPLARFTRLRCPGVTVTPGWVNRFVAIATHNARAPNAREVSRRDFRLIRHRLP